MALPPWYATVTLREELREGRSFKSDEFAIALQEVIAGNAPDDYKRPEQFFARTYFTTALRQHTAMTLRRLAGETSGTAPVMSLTTQFGGGKTHTLLCLYHLASEGPDAGQLESIGGVLAEAGLSEVPAARVAVFAGDAWDPEPNREKPWIDIARQIAGDEGVAALGGSSVTAPPGTTALHRLFEAAGGPVLLLFDEVLNFFSRHGDMAEQFRDFVQNLTTVATGADRVAAVFSLPSNRIEMTDANAEWQERINKIVRRVARDLIANDESEISQVVRRRLFDDLGDERTRRRVARDYAKWCAERSERIPREWTANGGRKPQDALRDRFEACYPFHPSTLSVFQRKWRAMPQFQQTRGTLAMLAQWVSLAARNQFRQARREPLITLGSAPLHEPQFRAAVLGQLGEQRLEPAIVADIAGDAAHAAALDADLKGELRELHRRVGTAILFESSGGHTDRVAHLPELRFGLGGPGVETTSIDNAAESLEQAGFFLRAIGTDGYRIHHQATLTKAVSDRRASLDEEKEIRPAMRDLVTEAFKDANLPLVFFPADSAAIPDSPRLTLVVADPREEWNGNGEIVRRIGEWTRTKNGAPRLYPGALVWCIRKPGRDLRNAVELSLAWSRVEHEVQTDALGAEFERAALEEVRNRARRARGDAQDEVWASYRYVVLADGPGGDLRHIDLGAGHSSSDDSLSARIRGALLAHALIADTVGASYLERNWPAPFEGSGAWPLASLRQSFLDGSLIRLVDPDETLRRKLPEFVQGGVYGLASGTGGDSAYDRLWYWEPVDADEISFEAGMYLLTSDKARELASEIAPQASPGFGQRPNLDLHGQTPHGTPSVTGTTGVPGTAGDITHRSVRIRVSGELPPESWNTFGTRVVTRLRSGDNLSVGVNIEADADTSTEAALREALADLGLSAAMQVEADE